MRKILVIATLLVLAAFAGQVFAGALNSGTYQTRTDTVITVHPVDGTTTVIDYGTFNFTAINGTYQVTGWGSGYACWTSIWGSALSPAAYAFLNGAGALNGISSELRAALQNGSYYSNNLGRSQESWMKSTDAWAAWNACHAIFGQRTAAASASCSQSSQVLASDKTVASVSYSTPTLNHSTITYEQGEGALITQVTTNYMDQTKTTNYTETKAKVNVNKYQITDTQFVSPIVLDMDNDGKLQASKGVYQPHELTDRFNQLDSTRLFDIYGDGFPVLTEWVGPQDGLLCVPKADGTIDGTSLFGNVDGYPDGYCKLTTYDANLDGKLIGNELNALQVWTDTNSNANVDKGELSTLAELGITQINLNHKFYKSTFVRNGKTCTMWDWFPAILEVEKM